VEFVRASGVENVPVLAAASEAVETETAAGVESTPAPALAIAVEDGDSANAPSLTITFSLTGMRVFQFSSSVSAPEGDREDWVQFTSSGPRVKLGMECNGNGSAVLQVMATEPSIACACGESKWVTVEAGRTYLVHIAAIEGSSSFTEYTLKVEQLP
jgi:hypothetical protein